MKILRNGARRRNISKFIFCRWLVWPLTSFLEPFWVFYRKLRNVYQWFYRHFVCASWTNISTKNWQHSMSPFLFNIPLNVFFIYSSFTRLIIDNHCYDNVSLQYSFIMFSFISFISFSSSSQTTILSSHLLKNSPPALWFHFYLMYSNMTSKFRRHVNQMINSFMLGTFLNVRVCGVPALGFHLNFKYTSSILAFAFQGYLECEDLSSCSFLFQSLRFFHQIAWLSINRFLPSSWSHLNLTSFTRMLISSHAFTRYKEEVDKIFILRSNNTSSGEILPSLLKCNYNLI